MGANGSVTFRDRSGLTITGAFSSDRSRLTYGFPYCDPPIQHTVTFVRE